MYFLFKMVIFHGYLSFRGGYILPNLNKVCTNGSPGCASSDFYFRLVPDWPPWPKWRSPPPWGKQLMEDFGKCWYHNWKHITKEGEPKKTRAEKHGIFFDVFSVASGWDIWHPNRSWHGIFVFSKLSSWYLKLILLSRLYMGVVSKNRGGF